MRAQGAWPPAEDLHCRTEDAVRRGCDKEGASAPVGASSLDPLPDHLGEDAAGEPRV